MNVAVPGRPTGPRDAVEAGSGAGGPHARTVTLPPSAEAPRATRRFLLGELTGDDARAARKAGGESADLDEDVIDTILLLATELVTNAVLHAGTAIVVALECGDHQITVRVIDRHPGPVAVRPAPTGDAALSENGRGLELVAALAASWGTEHTPNGKTVWFRLETAPTASLPPPLPPPASPADAQPAAAARGTIGGPPRLLSADLLAVLSAEDEIGELAARLVDAVGLDGAAVRRTLGAPDEVIVVATVGPTGDPSRARIIPLDAPGQRLGELLLWPRDPVLDDEGRARVRLTARWMALALRGADLRRAEERRIGMLSFLAETSDMLAGSLDVGASLNLLAAVPVPRLATWTCVHLLDADGTPRLAASAHVDERESNELAKRADDPAGPDIARVLGALRRDGVTSVSTARGPALLLVLKARHRLLGTMTIGRRPGAGFAPDELELFADLGRRASFALDNARLYGQQLAVSGALQAGLRPPELPTIAGLELGAAYRPARAGLDVGGDFFDLVEAATGDDDPGLTGDEAPGGSGVWTVTIGDVCGKGAEAAAVTGVARSVLRLLASQGRDVSDSLIELNRMLRGAALPDAPGRFCTAAVVRLEAAATPGGLILSLRLAGHPPPVRLTAAGEATLVGTPGTLLGILDDAEVTFPETLVELAPGDALVLYTDGVVEAGRGGAVMGEAGLLEIARSATGLSAQGIADRVRSAADRFAVGPPRDDLAVLVLRVPSRVGGPLAVTGPRRPGSVTRPSSVTLETSWDL